MYFTMGDVPATVTSSGIQTTTISYDMSARKTWVSPTVPHMFILCAALSASRHAPPELQGEEEIRFPVNPFI